MYDLIIIDDEEIVRRGFAEIINWNEIGFNLLAAFEDGKEAIAFLRKTSVDVILTDVKMVEVSGLEVAKYVHENMPGAKTVIISGYKEFEYAKKAIEFGVEYFLLKPTKFNELFHVFSEIRRKLDDIALHEQEKRKDREKYLEMIPLLREQFFHDLMTGELTEPDRLQKRAVLIDLPVDIHENPCGVVNMDIIDYDQYVLEKWGYGRSGLNNALMNFFREERDKIAYFPVYRNSSEWIIAAISLTPMDMAQQEVLIARHLRNIRNDVRSILGLDIQLRIDKNYGSMIELAKNYDVLKDKRQKANLNGGAPVSAERCKPDIPYEKDASMLKVIEDAQKYMQMNFHLDITLEDVANRAFLNPVYFSRIFKQITGENFIDFLTDLRMNRAMQLIGEGRHQIQEIGLRVGYNNSKYFSRVFKKYTGCTPREFSRRRRRAEGDA